MRFSEALALRSKLRDEVVCSETWLESILTPDPTDDRYWLFHEERYPPARDQTRMRVCLACERICPRHGIRNLCCDCETQQSEVAFLETLGGAQCSTELRDLRRRWWKRPVRYKALVDNQKSSLQGGELAAPNQAVFEPAYKKSSEGNAFYADDSKFPAHTRDERPQSSLLDPRTAAQIAQHWLSLPIPGLRLFDPISPSSLSQLPSEVADEVLFIAKCYDTFVVDNVRFLTNSFRRECRPLKDFTVVRRRGNIVLHWRGRQHCLMRCSADAPRRNVSAGTGRAAGCRFTLLSESEEALRREIAHFGETGEVHNSAKRFTRPNPFRRAWEDGRSVEDCFIRTRGESDFDESWEDRELRQLLSRIKSACGPFGAGSPLTEEQFDLLAARGFGHWKTETTLDGSVRRVFVMTRWNR